MAWFVCDIWHKCHSWYLKIVSNFTCLTTREITYNNFEISSVVFMPNITKIKTNHAITYTNTDLFLGWNKVNHLWNKHKHCSQRKIEGALLFSSVIHGSAELFARGKNWNGVWSWRDLFFSFLRVPLSEKLPRKWTSKTVNVIVKKNKPKQNENNFS